MEFALRHEDRRPAQVIEDAGTVASEVQCMRPSPFLQDPRDLLSQHVALAIAAEMPEIAAIHIRQAEHQAALAKASGLPITAP